MPDLHRLDFGTFVWRCFGRASTDAASYFGLNLKTAATTVILFAIGLFLYYRVKGASAVQEQAFNTFLLTVGPAILFIAGLLAFYVFRAPYLIYLDEYGKAATQVSEARRLISVAETKATDVNAELQRVLGRAATAERERDEARRAAQLQPPLMRQGLTRTQCEQLAQAIADYDAAINKATSERYSEASRANLETVFARTHDWLSKNVGPVQRQSFMTAGPVGVVYSGLPSAYAATWQVEQGRLNYLRDLANKLCG